MLSKSENLNVFITHDENCYGIHVKRVNFLFNLLPMCASNIITNVTKQNMNVMVLILSAFTCEALERQIHKVSAN